MPMAARRLLRHSHLSPAALQPENVCQEGETVCTLLLCWAEDLLSISEVWKHMTGFWSNGTNMPDELFVPSFTSFNGTSHENKMGPW